MTTMHFLMIIAVALVALGLVFANRRGGSGRLGFLNFEMSKPLVDEDASTS